MADQVKPGRPKFHEGKEVGLESNPRPDEAAM